MGNSSPIFFKRPCSSLCPKALQTRALPEFPLQTEGVCAFPLSTERGRVQGRITHHPGGYLNRPGTCCGAWARGSWLSSSEGWGRICCPWPLLGSPSSPCTLGKHKHTNTHAAFLSSFLPGIKHSRSYFVFINSYLCCSLTNYEFYSTSS